jgi:hypothetical protein
LKSLKTLRPYWMCRRRMGFTPNKVKRQFNWDVCL